MRARKKAGKNDVLKPEINIGLVGHVDHGKTTLVKALSGKWADTHSEEIKRGITIRLGYADVSFYKCEKCGEPEAWNVTSKCARCGKEARLVRKISLVDAPGHESLMATTLCGANIIDGALLLVSANEPCPQPQTMEHLTALQIIGVKNLVVVQNKIDIVSEEQAKKNYLEIKEFLKNTDYANAPIIPMSALHSVNLDLLVQTIQLTMPTPKRDLAKPPLMFVARSFDVNKPGTKPEKLQGGVLGGAIRQGQFKVGDEIELRPGYNPGKQWKPLTTTITSIITGGEKVETASPGGSVGMQTLLDPSIVKSDQLVGSVVGLPGKLPETKYELVIETTLLERLVGARDKLVMAPLKMNEMLMLNVNAAATVGIVKRLAKNKITCTLKRPVCAALGSRVTMSRMLGQRWRLIGYGTIQN